MRTILAILLLSGMAAMPGTAGAMQGLEGRWKSFGGEIELRHCSPGKGLCAVVASGDDSTDSMASIVGQVTARDIVADGPGRWRGRYVADNKDLAVTIRLRSPDVAEMRVCLLSWFPYLLCEASQFQRVKK